MEVIQFEKMIPFLSSFTWDDFYRFATNNIVGRKYYQPILNSHHDPGKAIGALADMVGEYFPANYWVIVYKYNFSEAEYFAVVNSIAEDITRQRGEDGEPLKYWQFVVNNSLRVLESALADRNETIK